MPPPRPFALSMSPQEPPSDIPQEEAREARSAKRHSAESQRAQMCAQVLAAPVIDQPAYVRLLEKQHQEQCLSLEEQLSILRYRLCDILAVKAEELSPPEVEEWLGHERRVFLFDHCIEHYRNAPRLWRRDHENFVRELSDADGNVQVTQQIDYGAAADLLEKPVEGLCRLLEGLGIRLGEVAFTGAYFGPEDGDGGLVGWDSAQLVQTARDVLLPIEDEFSAHLEAFRPDGYTALATVYEPRPGRPPRRQPVTFERTVKWLRGLLSTLGLKVHVTKEGIGDDGGPGGRNQIVTWDSQGAAQVFARREGSRATRTIHL